MVVEVRSPTANPQRIRKTRWAFHKADWLAFQADCEKALGAPVDGPLTVQQRTDRFEEALRTAAARHIPRGARADPRPWALDPALVEAVLERRAARAALSPDDPDSRVRWITAKRRAAELERRAAQDHFREFVSSTLNKPANLGRVHKTLKKWERGLDDEPRDGQAMEDRGKTISTDKDKAEAFAREYARVSRQVRVPKLDRIARHKMAQQSKRSCQECEGHRSGACSPFYMEDLVREISRLQLKKSPGPDQLRGRSVGDSIGRLIQEVHDGWQLPKARKKDPPEGTTAQKFVLTAYDFSRAYDVVDHRLLRVRLLELGLPHCMVRWLWQWLRDRRVRVEVNGVKSGERVFRAGLPQGSVLAPPLFLLWAAPLIRSLKNIPGCSPFMYADDTAALCSGADIQTAKRRAQLAADSLVEWARSSKMVVAGQKTQVMVLSQWARDAVDLSIKVAGVSVKARDTLNLLGVTLDRLLHFGQHCKKLKQRTRPRLAHLRRLTGRDWGLEEKQLRTVANGYVRGALEHAAEAWLPSTPPSHVEVLEREMRAAARIITGCVASTPTHALMAEAGLAPP
ncbi:putative RNA-directed DNA polymerase from transposon BS [Amphibalanus amphitrite]|uniref:Putative RNA-directed DNA polymerase from transposon BS n=1 Tax=Amphibalanus amphitrite TaxID=1232801 RepID=A0A6A4XGC3_AMPAM|nr:putative RNA-directed DNA polymerase from transposon BS [Amphibalanus amphitrite]